MFVYEGHRIKVKVTGTKIVKNPFSHNVKHRSAITPFLRIHDCKAVKFAYITGFLATSCVTAIFVA